MFHRSLKRVKNMMLLTRDLYVSLTYICYKTLVHILVSNINKHLAFDNILADCQHDFQSKRYCETSWSSLGTISPATWMGL